MFSIYKEKSRSQQLLNQSMLQEKEHLKNNLILSNPTHTKPIQKKKRQPLFGHKKKQEDKFSRHLTKDFSTNPRPVIDQSLKETAEYWLKSTKDWHLDSQAKADVYIQEEINKLPILTSIQELFSLSSCEKLTNQVDIDCFYRYCRTVSFLQSSDAAKITLTGEKASGVAHVGIDRHGSHIANSIYLLSEEELQVIQKRASFMEKIKENESKYDASIGRMSEISKELALNYRVYLQKRSQLIDSFNLLSAKIPPTLDKPQSAYDEYTQLLVKKNLKHAFSRTEIDPLNYFKFKEHSQSNRTDSFRHIMNPDELKMFIDRRKPKRGRKMHLATACSVCLSDYHQMSNAFQTCSVCGLRAHKMCFTFENSKCGNCAYRKIERNVKEQVSPCFICKQRGLMTIKLGEREFAHAFCLLVHGYWKVKSEGKHEAGEPFLPASNGRYSSEVFLQSGFRKFCSNQIEFVNPNQNYTSSSIPAIDSTIYASHQIEEEEIESDNNSSLGRIGIIGEREDVWDHPAQSKKTICKCCQQNFYKNCYLSCETCQQQCHIFCAFLSGFDLRMSDNSWSSGIEGSILLNCCCERSNQVSWSRKYKLNFERIAFNIDEIFDTSDKDLMQNDKDGLLFSI